MLDSIVAMAPEKSLKTPYQLWQVQMQSGNSNFEQGNYFSAIAHYQQAISLAEELLEEHPDFRAAIASLMVTHHNLADVYLLQGQQPLAEAELELVHNKLIGLYERFGKDADKEPLILWGLRRTYTALLLHRKKFVISEKVEVPQMPSVMSGTTRYMN